MVKFIGLKIQGIRSVGDSPQCINFLTPLTIIQGPNGTGKTTIIEALNYVTTGSLPAGNMATFIHNHQIANKPRVDALVQLIFEDIKGNRCTATKRMTSATKGGKLTTKSDEFTLKVVDKHGNLKASSSKVSDFNKEMLNLFGVPKAVLEYVLFCHQEDSNWPLSEPKELKKRFDAIFEVTKFVKALENIKKNVKEMNNQIQLIDKEMPHLMNNLRALTELRMNYDKNINISRDIKTTIERLLEEKRNTEQELLTIRKQRERAITANHEFEILQGQIATHRRYMDGLCDKEYAGTRDDLIVEIENLKQSIALEDADNQRANIMQEIRSIAEEIDKAKKAEAYYRDQMIQYNSKQMMMKNREQDYMSLVKQYADEYNVPINPEFAEYLQMELDATQTSGEKFIKKEQERINVLDEQIDKLRCRLVELKSNSQTKRQEFGRLSQIIGNMEKELKNADNTFQAVGKISQEIGKLESQLKSIGDAKLLDDLWEIVQTLQSELNTLRMDMMEFGGHNDEANSAAAAVDALKEKTTNVLEGANEKLGRTLEHIGTLKRRVQMQSQLMEMKDRKAVAGEKVVHRDTLKQNLDERKEQLAEVENILTTASKESPQLENELRALEAERRKAKESLQAFERDSNVQIERMNTAIRKLAEYKADNERDKQASAATENFREKMDEQKNLIEQLAEQRRQRENQLSGAEVQKSQLRQLGEQLRRMEIQNEVKILSRKLEEAKENAILDGVESIAELKKKEDRLNQRVLNLNNQIHQKNGEQLQLRKKIDELKMQLAKPQYEQAKKNLLDKMVERNITNSAIEDLEKYYKVVDDAIINFHQQKMEQINQILRDLWIRVYRANDIETIKIKSKPVGGSEKKKSYDYSVVMTVDQTDLDMRDRCSAGQKVLASIVIRVALADVFAGGCRILALDEPTTNLDADKVENIGQMLKDLLEIRNNPAATGSAFGAQELNNADDADFEVNGASSSHETFLQPPPQQNSSMQLIVITHDHRLVEHLHLACRPEYIYALSKDDKGISRIKAYNNVVEAGDDLTNAMD